MLTATSLPIHNNQMKVNLGERVPSATMNGNASQTPRSAWFDRCQLAKVQVMQEVTRIINDQLSELLVKLQVIEAAQRLGSLPTLSYLEKEMWDRTMLRQVFRVIARRALEQLRPLLGPPSPRPAQSVTPDWLTTFRLTNGQAQVPARAEQGGLIQLKAERFPRLRARPLADADVEAMWAD